MKVRNRRIYEVRYIVEDRGRYRLIYGGRYVGGEKYLGGETEVQRDWFWDRWGDRCGDGGGYEGRYGVIYWDRGITKGITKGIHGCRYLVVDRVSDVIVDGGIYGGVDRGRVLLMEAEMVVDIEAGTEV